VPVPGGDLEQAVLAALWNIEGASAPEIHARVGEPRGLGYTTTATVLDRLYAKRLVRRVRRGRSFFYTAALPREVIETARIGGSLRRLLGPEPKPAIATLVDALEEQDPALIDELARLVNARRRSRDGS
jgi:BlaI family transcriptional regulator, penicillinase repressor